MPPSYLPTVGLNGEREEKIVSPGNNTSPGKYTDKWSKKTSVSKVKMMHRKIVWETNGSVTGTCE